MGRVWKCCLLRLRPLENVGEDGTSLISGKYVLSCTWVWADSLNPPTMRVCCVIHNYLNEVISSTLQSDYLFLENKDADVAFVFPLSSLTTMMGCVEHILASCDGMNLVWHTTCLLCVIAVGNTMSGTVWHRSFDPLTLLFKDNVLVHPL